MTLAIAEYAWKVEGQKAFPSHFFPTTVAQIQHLLSLQASIMWPNRFLLIWMDCCLRELHGTCQLMQLQRDFLCRLWTSCGLVAPVPSAILCSDLSPPLKGQFHRKQNFSSVIFVFREVFLRDFYNSRRCSTLSFNCKDRGEHSLCPLHLQHLCEVCFAILFQHG